jgi:type IV pilus assembly protein PilY1
MFNKLQSILPSRLASAMLTAVLFAALTAPFVMLQSRHAFAAPPPLPCTQGNNNGCTELSATPPEDLQPVPPNIVLMLDDSGSMAWDFMPDWAYLANTTAYGTRNSGINAVYYNPETTYTPPPKVTASGTVWQADGTWYPNSPGMTGAYTNGFAPPAATNIVNGSGYSTSTEGHVINYTDSLLTTLVNTTITPGNPAIPPADKGPAVWGGGTAGSPGDPGSPGGGCISGYHINPLNAAQCIRDPVAATQNWTCHAGDGSAFNSGGVQTCHHYVWQEGIRVDQPYAASKGTLTCPGGTTGPVGGFCSYPPIGTIPPTPPTAPVPPTPNYKWICPSGSTFAGSPPGPPGPAPECWTSGSPATPDITTNTPIYVRAFTYVVGNPVSTNSHYVIPNVTFNGQTPPAGGWCNVLSVGWQKTNCTDGNIAGKASPAGVTADQNVANWFSYYRTRMLMTKTGLMNAFLNVDAKYRVGFGSINGNAKTRITGPVYSATGAWSDPTTSMPYVTFDDSYSNSDGSGGDAANRLAIVQPYGVGTDANSQKTKFWTWLANQSPAKGTPLRKALAAAGEYYKTAQPWQTMKNDPGYTTGSTTPFTCRAAFTILTTDGFWNGDAPTTAGMANAANLPGPSNTVPAGRTVTQYTPVDPYQGGSTAGGAEPSLADVATYYWANDLNTSLANEVSVTTSDPASWQHMTTYTIGLGFKPVGIQPIVPAPDTRVPQIFGWASGGAAITGFAWPVPSSDSVNNIADLAHAALNGHGDFFNVNNPADLADAFSKISADVAARTTGPTPTAVNASVLSLGAASFRTGYTTGVWSSTFDQVTLKTDGSVDAQLWGTGGADGKLNAAFHSPSTYTNRKVYTGSTKTGTFTGYAFTAADAANLDTAELAGLQAPPLLGGSDTLGNRINYLLGDNSNEGTTYRARTNILGAILHAEPVYVAGASGNYRDSWPTFGTYTPPEAVTGAQTFAAFVSAEATRAQMVYVGANDGMLHAFNAPVPECTGTIDTDGNCSAYSFTAGANEGQEAWAFVPRAIYANLGNLTNKSDFQFLPTVDATPTSRDVFFSDKNWHTILAGGVGMGGRGVYGLDITSPGSFSASSVLWEFDADMTPDSSCTAVQGAVVDTTIGCRGTDLGFTVAQPNVGRLSNGKWVVLVPNGYFPDCGTPDFPTATNASCSAIAAQAPKDASNKPYSALFVLDAETGKVIAELKTPTDVGVTSFGLSKPVLGDYNSDQVDDVAFAGDVQGNLWRFNMSNPDPTKWAVTLVYKGLADASGKQGVQPITTMPRLFPDPTTNRFMVVFGTGKYLGVGDNDVPSGTPPQAIIAVRDVAAGTTYSQTDLQQQYLHETVVPAFLPDGITPNPDANAGVSLRCITGSATNNCTADINTVASSKGGWFVNLTTTTSDGTVNDAGERVVVNPAAIFSTNTVIFETLITGSLYSDACNPTTAGAILALNALTGGSGGVSSLGGSSIAGARIVDARTSGSLPVISAVGGGKAYFPGANLPPPPGKPGASGPASSTDIPNWRRRSWRVLLNDQ